MRHKRAPHTCIHQNKSLIFQPNIILRQDLRVRTQIIACIIPLHDLYIRFFGHQGRSVIRLPIENEDEVRFGMEAMV
jgi:hypothetical protein